MTFPYSADTNMTSHRCDLWALKLHANPREPV